MISTKNRLAIAFAFALALPGSAAHATKADGSTGIPECDASMPEGGDLNAYLKACTDAIERSRSWVRTCSRQQITQDELNAMTWRSLGSRANPVANALKSDNVLVQRVAIGEFEEVKRRVVASLPETCRWHRE